MAIGVMTDKELGRFIKGWSRRTPEVIDQTIEQTALFRKVFPTRNYDTERMDFFYWAGEPGRTNVSIDEPVEFVKWDKSYTAKDMTWTKFPFKISDAAISRALKNDMAKEGVAQSARYFSAVKDFQIGTELLAKAGTSAAVSDGAWDAGGDIITDIVTAITSLRTGVGVNPGDKIGVCYPVDVENGLLELDLIHNVQQTVMDYLSKTYKINWYPFSPYKTGTSANTYIDVKTHDTSDWLTTSALVFLEGNLTLRCGTYRPAGVLMTETERDFDSGNKFTTKMCSGALAVPNQNSSTSARIYEITAVDA